MEYVTMSNIMGMKSNLLDVYQQQMMI